MREASVAISAMLLARMPTVPTPLLPGSVPSMKAWTLEAIRFDAIAPAPDRPMPAKAPVEAATEPAKIKASMSCAAVAVSVSAPPVVTVESSMDACTPVSAGLPSAS